MDVRLVDSEIDYHAALALQEELYRAKPESGLYSRLVFLGRHIRQYEQENPVELPSGI